MEQETQPSSSSSTRPRWRTHFVAALVLFHVVGIVIASLPAPLGGMSRTAWKDPTVQEEFAAWSARFASLGLTIPPPELEERAWKLAKGWMRVRTMAMRPFRAYQSRTGSYQSWSMFVAPHRYPTRLHVDIRGSDEEWRPLYVARSDEHTWRRSQFDQIRVRSAIFRYGWPQFVRKYDQFVAWLARAAHDDFPDATELRVRMYKARTPTPAEVDGGARPEGKFIYSRSLTLGVAR